ncbi:cytochrome c1 [Rhizobiaceae bacterium BDR2-2]|uniref:Cytochrome c1 n=1 Tax=Ectorhizobium quercum TaxID=2965071 RepID=A0AAE3MZJ6_9HYPH|nr:cytochrome c1 [Ectorhizobium quercum]MCX8996585.1 cytochrome c1 [Ectorhizobium quercum]
MKKLVASIALIAAVTGFGAGSAVAAEGHGLAADVEHAVASGHFPVYKPQNLDWSFAGPFGTYDKAQLQRGLQVYKDICAACHSMSLVPFRMLGDLGYTEDQVKAFAAEYTVTDGPDAEGEMFERPAIPSDHFPSPFPNEEAAAAANNGAAPPDFSLIAKARGVERGFPTFIFDIFTQYQEGGPDYIYSLLTGYVEPPEDFELPDGAYFNPHFVGGATLAMAPPLSDEAVEYEDGTPMTLDNYAKDVSAFLMWAAEPHLEERKKTGLMVMIFLVIFSGFLYLTKRSVYASKEH